MVVWLVVVIRGRVGVAPVGGVGGVVGGHVDVDASGQPVGGGDLGDDGVDGLRGAGDDGLAG